MVMENYNEKLNFNEIYKDGLNKLTEQRVKADINEYERQKQERPDFEALVTTRGEELPGKYKNLLGETFPKYKNKTLDDLIKQSIDELGGEDVYFSVDSSGTITGFIAIVVDEDENKVNNIKMCSLKSGNDNEDIMPDLKCLLDELIQKFDSVSWEAVDTNRANGAYKLYAKHHNGEIIQVESIHKIFYKIPGIK